MLSLLFLFWLLPTPMYSTDVTWIPADTEPVLPASKHYQDQLRALCLLLDNPTSPLPPSFKEKEHNIRILCKKLAQIEEISTVDDDGHGWLGVVLLVLVGVGVGYIYLMRRGDGRRGGGEAVAVKNVREARLRRFENK